MTTAKTPERVYLEIGSRRVFACSLEWPGWCRSAGDEAVALDVLAAYAHRYRAVADEAGVPFPPGAAAAAPDGLFTVVERLAGSAATDFGALDAIPEADAEPLTTEGADRSAELVAAAWRLFDRVVTGAPAILRKGPRGGGRDRDQIVAHVIDAERSYARKFGVRFTPTQVATPGGLESMRAELLERLRAAREGMAPVDRGWPPRYAARRLAWHVLDHAWEIEDKSD